MDHADIVRIVASRDTVSDKIRALNAGGCSRAEIARLLGKRYQHVRNVLEADKLRPSAGLAEPAAQPFVGAPRGAGAVSDSARFRLVLGADGAVRLPVELVEAWGLSAGSVLIGRLEGDEFRLVTAETSIARARALVRQWVPGEVMLSEELIADRRREAAREERDG